MELSDRIGTEEESRKLGLLAGEYDLICSRIGRKPTFTELAMFSGMWSEHCSYKNSILLLRELYSKSDRLLAKPGEENAGALRINDRQAVVFKIESHNHPSAIEPYQGAATGVGGIMRDVFTMGARPLVSLNSLRFGNPDTARNRWLLREVVRGIGNYGNSLGIACAGGEVFFHPSYTKNPLVNAMVIGIADVDAMASARAKGPGNLVMYVGAKTGRDGIHGASFASKDLSAESEEERSAVQVGDPFLEKLVMEATLECIRAKLVVAIQDMGAAGLVSSSSEMSASGGVGMDLHLDRVPAREDHMVPFEFLLSESQERMLMVVEPSRKDQVISVFRKWSLDAVEIGVVTDTAHLRIFHDGKLYADLPARALAVDKEGAPRYKRESSRPARLDAVSRFEEAPFSAALKSGNSAEAMRILTETVKHPNHADKADIIDQYDTDIGTDRVVGPGQNAGIYRVPDSKQAIAAATDGNGYYIHLDPWNGSLHNVAEARRNVIAAGAEPIGITNCLNFANPFKPENFYFFEQAVKAMSHAAEFFRIPITGGNVSFYNESEDGPVLPTPTLGMVGVLEDAERALTAALSPGEVVYLLGHFQPSLEASMYRYILKGTGSAPLPAIDLQLEKNAGDALLNLNAKKLLKAATDLSSGGILMALLRMIFAAGKRGLKSGFVFEAVGESDLFYFGESAATYLVSVAAADTAAFEKNCPVPCRRLGSVENSDRLEVESMSFSLPDLQKAWRGALADCFLTSPH